MGSVRPLIADLFCGAGGGAMGLSRAGFRVVGFDIVKQPRYPFGFVQQDALTVDLEPFDAVWASPPCQRYSPIRLRRDRKGYPDLVSLTRFHISSAAKPYVIENVPGAPVRPDVTLCGEMFGLSPNPPKDTDGRREGSGRGWVRELQGRWPGVLG